MKKISTLFKKNPENLGLVIDEINPENDWVFNTTDWMATRKFDGTAAAIIDGVLYKRYDVKKGKSVPENAIPCQEPDEITGHWPHWVKCDSSNPADKYFLEALQWQAPLPDGTYELCGPKIQGNPEKFDKHTLVKHGAESFFMDDSIMNFEGIKYFLSIHPIEGIVFHRDNGDMCKIRKSDFGIKR